MSLPLISCILLTILFPVFDDDVVPCALPFAEGPKLSLSVLRYVQETLITFPLILFTLCVFCMRIMLFEYLGRVGWIFMARLLSRQPVSFPAKPLDLMP